MCLIYVKKTPSRWSKKDWNVYEFWWIVCENIHNFNIQYTYLLVLLSEEMDMFGSGLQYFVLRNMKWQETGWHYLVTRS